MRFESFLPVNYSNHIERCITLYDKTELSEQSFDALKELYKAESYQYPEFINAIKGLEDQGKLSAHEHIILVGIFLYDQKNGMKLENFKVTVEAIGEEKTPLFDYEEVRNAGLSENTRSYLEYCIDKITK